MGLIERSLPKSGLAMISASRCNPHDTLRLYGRKLEQDGPGPAYRAPAKEVWYAIWRVVQVFLVDGECLAREMT